MKNFSKADSSQTHIFTSFPETHQDQDDDMTEVLMKYINFWLKFAIETWYFVYQVTCKRYD